ncbi:peptidoglycan DD-metalloendopeptidase family protein [Gammaproteobacteria bacterium]|nr:peptidoglycan DD-metalloendopeptidase family protein [Gammaproteobacteria bacterium]
MKIIIVDQKHGETKSLVLTGWMRVLLTVCLLGLPVFLGYYSYQFSAARNADMYTDKAAQAWADKLGDQEENVQKVKEEALAQLQALTIRVASLQARLLRLDALGERLTTFADLDDGEFDFSQVPAVGGPVVEGGEQQYQAPDFIQALDDLTRQIEDRQQQLEIIDNLLSERQTQSDALLAGRPVSRGWMSSPYGRRIDPFTGNLAWHQGVDFATGSLGVDVSTVASGVVTYAGERQGYGLMVEVSHGNGYETLYAHGQEILVKPGDIVKKGQVIALSGSSGRSTGPHVHFEVHKNGRVVDPASYIQRTDR